MPSLGEVDSARFQRLLLYRGLLELKEVVAGPFATETAARQAQAEAHSDVEEILRQTGSERLLLLLLLLLLL